MKKLIIIGAGGHGSVVADAAAKSGYETILFLDDGGKETCLGYPVVGKTAEAEKYQDHDFFVAIGNAKTREKILNQLTEKGLNVVNIIHPSAVIAKGVTLGKGVLLCVGSIVNPNATLGDGVIINTLASVDHDSKVGDYCHVSAGGRIGAIVTIEKGTFVGISATVISEVHICEDCMIGAGAVVVKDITEKGTYVGVPAKKIK